MPCCQVAPPGDWMYFMQHCAVICWSAYIALNACVSLCLCEHKRYLSSSPSPLPVCFGWVPVPPWLRGFILGCCGGVWRLQPWAPPLGKGRERPYVIHIVWLGRLAAGEQAGNPIAALLSSLDTAGGTTSGQTVQPITGPLQLSLVLYLSMLCPSQMSLIYFLSIYKT